MKNLNYIGPFFRMSTLSCDEIKSELFSISKESIKHIELQSRCGILSSGKLLKKALTTNDINILRDFSPVSCIYKKSHPLIMKSGKHPMSWDADTIKKEICPDSNALLTYSILQLSSYYSYMEYIDTNLYSLSTIYMGLSKIQLDFYSSYLRNCDGLFVDKKNDGESYSDSMVLIDKSKGLSYSYQSFMMCAYYDYAIKSNDKDKSMYRDFSLEILKMLIDYRESIYQESLEENLKICLSLNIFYSMSHDNDAKILLTDLCDMLIDEYDANVKGFESLSSKSLLSINLFKGYEYTNIDKFKDKSLDISRNILSLYDKENNVFKCPQDKKEVKFTSYDLLLTIINLLLYQCDEEECSSEIRRHLLPNMYKSLIVSSGIVTSFPDAPDLNSPERYKNFSFNSKDLIDENNFKPSSAETPSTCGLSSIFVKNVTYSKKKNIFSHTKTSFDSQKNMFLMSLIIYLFEDDFIESICGHNKPQPIIKVRDSKDYKDSKYSKSSKDSKYSKESKYSKDLKYSRTSDDKDRKDSKDSKDSKNKSSSSEQSLEKDPNPVDSIKPKDDIYKKIISDSKKPTLSLNNTPKEQL